MKPIAWFFALCLVCCGAFAQMRAQPVYKLEYRLPVAAQQIALDKMGFLYAASERTLYKYNSSGEQVFRFNENRLGAISHVDASNPFQVLAYYRDYQTVLLLDRTLSELGRFNLSELGVSQVDAIGLASDNNVWFYDPNTFLLEKVDARAQRIQQSPDMSLLVASGAFQPNRIVERDNQLFVNDPQHGIFVLDRFCNFVEVVLIRQVRDFQLVDKQLYYLAQGRLRVYNLQTQDETELELPAKDALQACVGQGQIWLRFADRIEGYSWK